MVQQDWNQRSRWRAGSLVFFFQANCTDIYKKTHAAELLSGEKVNAAGFPIYIFKDQALIELGIGDHAENLIPS